MSLLEVTLVSVGHVDCIYRMCTTPPLWTLPPRDFGYFQWINHPIANDPCYGGELFFGDADAERRAEQDPRTRGWRGAGNRVNTYTKEDTREAEVQGVHAKGELITTEDEEERRTNDTNGDKGVPEKSSEHVRENSGDRMAVDRRRSVVLGDEKPTLKVGLSLEVQSTTEHATDSIVDNTKPTGSGTTAAGDGPGDPSEASESTGGNAEEVEEKKDGEDDEAFIVRNFPTKAVGSPLDHMFLCPCCPVSPALICTSCYAGRDFRA